MFLTGNIGRKDFVCGAFDGAMAFAASISFPWDLVQSFSICYHFSADSLVVHIKESLEQDNDADDVVFLGIRTSTMFIQTSGLYPLAYGMLAMVASNSAICWSLLPAI